MVLENGAKESGIGQYSDEDFAILNGMKTGA